MMRRAVRIMPVIVLLLCSSCAPLTPAQRTLWAIRVYQQEYDNYLEKTIDPEVTAVQKEALKKDPSLITPAFINYNLSADERKILRVKKEILIELKPLILMAAEYEKTGALPNEDVQRKMTSLINRLVELSMEDNP